MTDYQKQLVEKYWTESHEKQLNEHLGQNDDLRKLFEKHPEKKELYKFKLLDSGPTEYPPPLDNICCKNCLFQLSPCMIGGVMTSRHTWAKCKIMDDKPHEILYDGAKCEFYEKQK